MFQENIHIRSLTVNASQKKKRKKQRKLLLLQVSGLCLKNHELSHLIHGVVWIYLKNYSLYFYFHNFVMQEIKKNRKKIQR